MINNLLGVAFCAQRLAQFLDGSRKERAGDGAAVRTSHHPRAEALDQPALRPENEAVVSPDDQALPATDGTLLPNEVHDASFAPPRHGCKHRTFSIFDFRLNSNCGEQSRLVLGAHEALAVYADVDFQHRR